MPSINTISCPQCNHEFQLTDVMAAPLVAAARADAQKQIDAANQKASKAETDLKNERAKLEIDRAEFVAKVQEAAIAKQPEIEARIRQQVSAENAADLNAKETRNQELEEKLRESRRSELAAEKARQTAEDKVAASELEVARKVSAQTKDIREQAIKQATEDAKQKLDEQELLIKRLTEQAEELKRQAQVGSQQLQGDAAELDLKQSLEAAFKRDEIEEIKTGQRGADWRQVVFNDQAQRVGTILWESKNAQSFGGDWLAKAKQDARKDKADLVVIVSNVLPKGITHFDCCDDVWVVNPAYVTQLAKALRNDLIATAGARRTAEGRTGNAERVYDYLMGPDFVSRIKGIAEPFVIMQADLEKERRSMTQHWARRQKHIDRVLEAAFGMRGDIEALAGQDLPELDAVELKALPLEVEEEVA